ncbi:beta-lactamase/transpeptidase-like protein [Lophiostoma macrostomum CBS 122681]|uniref:Beta-lactamase/transpeptidase-like protein n=1 Tax=Lophiostoma macrostomum CBS 122681 TaxID=1314788 RepID=A0A6A6SSS3_9PLEO|nr:beta-lactamase/transpeptidase-like protein [Lophiostoma macrostomum CBS 122681]
MKTSVVYILAALTASVLAQLSPNCPLLGPVFPSATDLARSNAFQDTANNFPRVLDSAFASGLLDNETTSFSISVYSEKRENPLFSYHFASPGLNGSLPSGQLDDDTIYRIGSVTKLLTVYSILAQNGDADFAKPITDYIPELKNVTFKDEIDSVRWSEVTVQSLASHMAGLSRQYSLYDLATLGGEALGLPTLESSSIPSCGVVNNNKGLPTCSQTQLINGLLSQRPLTSTFNTPIYSNSGFALLGWVLERITNKTYQDAVQTLLYEPLNLTRSSIVVPDDTTNIITPYGSDSQFSLDLGGGAAAGAAYSSLADFNRLGRSILSSELLPKALTRRWMKPLTHTSNPLTAVGAPWEILRYNTPVSAKSNTTRLIDIYGKSGDVGLYSSFIGLDVDHGIGFNILVAGNNTTSVRFALAGLITESFLPAAEEAAREEANATFSGTYSFAANGQNANLTLSVDEQPGLKLELEVNGVNFRTLLAEIYGEAYANASLRLYPAGLKDGSKRKMTAVFDPVITGPEYDPFGLSCASWSVVDGLQYGGVGLDEFEVEFGQDKVESVTALGLRITLDRI